MAAIRNPIYYKNQAIGTANFDTSQWIYLGKEHLSGYIEIPRGLYGNLVENAENAGISYEVKDERQKGKHRTPFDGKSLFAFFHKCATMAVVLERKERLR